MLPRQQHRIRFGDPVFSRQIPERLVFQMPVQLLLGILAQSAITGPGNTSALCFDLGGGGALSNTFTHSLGGVMAGGDVRVRQRNDGTVRLPGYAGGATNTGAVIAYLSSRNTLVSPPTATFDSTGFAGGAACAAPIIP